MGSNITELENKLELLESELQKGHNMVVEEEYLITKGELKWWKKCEKTRFAQFAKKKWLTEEDKNSTFFHAMVNQRRNASQLQSMRLENEDLHATSKEIHEGAVHYFQTFLSE